MTPAKLIVALLFVAVNSYAYNNLATGGDNLIMGGGFALEHQRIQRQF